MSESIALIAVVFVNAVIFLFGCSITGLSYVAYRSSGGSATFRRSTIGFGFITLGCVVEPVFQFGIKRDWNVSSQELLQLQALEGTFIAIGLGLLFVSIFRHGRSRSLARSTPRASDAPVVERTDEFDVER